MKSVRHQRHHDLRMLHVMHRALQSLFNVHRPRYTCSWALAETLTTWERCATYGLPSGAALTTLTTGWHFGFDGCGLMTTTSGHRWLVALVKELAAVTLTLFVNYEQLTLRRSRLYDLKYKWLDVVLFRVGQHWRDWVSDRYGGRGKQIWQYGGELNCI